MIDLYSIVYAFLLELKFLFFCGLFQWRVVQIGRWTTWSTRSSSGNPSGSNAHCSMDISGPTTATRRARDSAWCGTRVQDTGTLRSPSASTAPGWAKRRTPYGSGRRSWKMLDTTPASWGTFDYFRATWTFTSELLLCFASLFNWTVCFIVFRT